MNARASIVARRDRSGHTRLVTLRSEPPLVLRDTPAGVYLVGGAAGPVGGDRIALTVDVGPGAQLTVRSAAATLVFPGRAESRMEVHATVAPGGGLEWLPEPLVAVRGARHRSDTRIDVADGASLTWRDEVVLGRHLEEGGAVTARMALDVAGAPVLRQELMLDPSAPTWTSYAVGAGARAAGSIVLVDPSWTVAPSTAAAVGDAAAVLPLPGPAVQVTAIAGTAGGLRAALDRGWSETVQVLDGFAPADAHLARTLVS